MFDEISEKPVNAAELIALTGFTQTACPICNSPVTAADIQGERAIIAAEGMPGEMILIAAHIEHFFKVNPATGNVSGETHDYKKNLEIFSIAWLSATGHIQENRG